MKQIQTIGTHDGTFHCDEVLGCSMLKLLYPNATIVRSRAPDILSECDIVIDVGGKYDPEKNLFDHHQRDFNLTGRDIISGKPWDIKLSSAGLVYCHFGKDILRAIVKDLSDDSIDTIFDQVYENFVREIDAIDNGVPICDGKQAYTISTNLSARVQRINRKWTESENDFNETAAFNKALALVSEEFIERVKVYINEWLPAKDIVLKAAKGRYDIDSTGEIIELETFCPWKKHLFKIEEDMQIQPKLKFVIFKDISPQWRVQAVPIDENSFILRTPLLETWRGLRGEELSKTAGIEGCIFVHSTGFIGINQSKEGALKMAKTTLEHIKKSC